MTLLDLVILAVPVAALAAYGIASLAYRLVARDIARRLRRRAQVFERTGKRPELAPGLHHAADLTYQRTRGRTR